MTPGISANARQLYRFWDKKRAYLDYAPFDPSLDFELSIEVCNSTPSRFKMNQR